MKIYANKKGSAHYLLQSNIRFKGNDIAYATMLLDYLLYRCNKKQNTYLGSILSYYEDVDMSDKFRAIHKKLKRAGLFVEDKASRIIPSPELLDYLGLIDYELDDIVKGDSIKAEYKEVKKTKTITQDTEKVEYIKDEDGKDVLKSEVMALPENKPFVRNQSSDDYFAAKAERDARLVADGLKKETQVDQETQDYLKTLGAV